ncbi:biopolymer transporter ExbD [bacterium]|nr:biopolymer transporter ExbD [bacterium]
MAFKHRKTFNEINITPLTDIFLVLLIIMMVVAPLLDQQGLNLVVPDNVEAEQIKKDIKILNVIVTNDDEIYIEDNLVDVNSLKDVISEQKKNYPDGLMIQTEPEATHGTVTKVMDNARNAGVVSISIAEI